MEHERKIETSHLHVIWLLVNHIFTSGYESGIPLGLDFFFLFGIGLEIRKVDCFVSRKEMNTQIQFQNFQVIISFMTGQREKCI